MTGRVVKRDSRRRRQFIVGLLMGAGTGFLLFGLWNLSAGDYATGTALLAVGIPLAGLGAIAELSDTND